MPFRPKRELPRALLVTAGLLSGVGPALAHPHIWVTAKAELAYEGGRLTGIRHSWRFDKSYSAYVTQGLDKNGDGRLSPEELQDLATTNTENLAEYAYFTKLKIAGKEQGFSTPREARMAMEDGRLSLTFVLPVASPTAQGKGIATFEVYDPTYLVAFSLAEGSDAARLSGAPSGCATNITRAKNSEPVVADAGGQGLTEAFFEALTAASNYGEQFANRVLVACP